jgi:protein-disulfide isomerase
MNRLNRTVGIVLGAILGVAITAMVVPDLPRRPLPPRPAAPGRGAEDPRAVYRVPLEDSPVKGPADALVTVVISSDFECPFCRRVLPTLAQLEREYAGKLRFAFKHNPLGFHRSALPAALAAEEARAQGGDGKFWAMHDALFEAEALDAAAIDAAARKVGLDAAAVKAAIDDQRHLARVKRDQQLVTGLGATGTPSFFVNGRKLVGAQPYAAFQALVDEELAKAEKLVQSGVPRAEVYARTIARGATAPARLPAGEGQPDRPAPPPAQAAKVTIRPDDPARGPEAAKLTIVVFSEFQCPFCARVEPTLKRIQETWPEAVRIVWKHQPLPFHPQARPAALAAEAARAQGKFWELHDRLFANQAALAPERYEEWAKELGLDLERFRRDAAADETKARVDEDQRLAAQVGAQGTPTLFLNCRKVVGALPFESFQPIVEEELKKADAAIAGGAKPGPALYERLCDANLKALGQGARAEPAPPPAAPPALDAKALAAAVRADDPVRGARQAPVTVLVFSDFQCPFCSRAVPTIERIEAAYRDDVRIVWKHQPLAFHANAVPAALAAEAAREQGKFWEMHDKLFENQRDLSAATLERLARELGLDEARFRAAMGDPRLKARIEQDRALAEKVGASGTPTFIVGGERVVGAVPFDTMKPVIDRQLALAKGK